MNHQTQERTTKGGVKLLFIQAEGAKSCSILFAVRAGYRYANDDNKLYERPHLLEHMVFDGSERYPTSDALQEVFTERGGDGNGFTDSYYSGFMFRAKPPQIEKVLDAAVDMIYRPLLTQKAFTEELEVIRNELGEILGNFAGAASSFSQKQVVPDALLTVDEELQHLDEVTLEDVKAYHKEYYTQKNSRLIICGEFKRAAIDCLVKTIEAAMEGVTTGQSVPFKKCEIQPPQPAKPVIVPIGRSIEDSYTSLQFMVPGKLTLEQRWSMRLFDLMATSMKSYSANHILRKKGLTYGLDCSGFETAECYGYEINIMAPYDRYPRVLAYSLEEMKKLSRNGVTQEQFKAARHELAAALDDASESVDSLVEWYSEGFLWDKGLHTPQQVQTLIERINQKEMLKLMTGLISYDRMSVSILTSKMVRIGGATASLTEEVMKKDTVMSDELIESKIFMLYKNTRGWKYWVVILLMLVVGASMLPALVHTLIPGVSFADYTYELYGWWMIPVVLYYGATFLEVAANGWKAKSKEVLFFAAWAIVGLLVVIVFEERSRNLISSSSLAAKAHFWTLAGALLGLLALGIPEYIKTKRKVAK